VNGQEAGTVAVDGQRRERTLHLREGLLRDGVNRIVFRFRSANRGGAGDPREMAVFFHWLELHVEDGGGSRR
jgi:hypothetical protein